MQPEKVLIDSHLHLDRFTEPAGLEVRAARSHHALIPGIEPPQWRDVLKRYGVDPCCDIALGLHPWWVGRHRAEVWQPELRSLLEHESVVGLGEVGLDHLKHRDEAERAQAAAVFRWQVALAVERGLPLVIHCVRAHGDVMRILREEGASRVGGVIHAFSGSPELARQYLDEGFVVGLGSPVSRPQSRRVRRAAATVSDAGYLLETDAPFMNVGTAPSGEGRLENINVVLQEVAALRGVAREVILRQTSENYRRIFARTRLCS